MRFAPCAAAFALLIAGCATAGHQSSVALSERAVSSSIVGGGRNIMRSPEGTLITAFVEARPRSTQLYFAGSRDDGQTWYRVASPHLGRHNPGTDEGTDPAIDSNVDGAYLAFVDGGVGRVVYSAQPFANPAEFQHSEPLTPAGRRVRHSFVAATRVGWGDRPTDLPASVAYGWVDPQNGDIYVGVSRDGRAFPTARKVHADPDAASGPAIGIHGDYVLLMYLSRAGRYAPGELAASSTGREYQVWMESRDGGRTWSDPTPLFGTTLRDFPRVPTAAAGEAGQVVRGNAIVAGGSPGILDHSQLLVWAPPGSNIVFVMSSLRPVGPNGQPIGPDRGGVGVVSFKPLAPGSSWTHVVANRGLTLGAGAQTRVAGPEAAAFAPATAQSRMHQYSALPLTPFRAVTYLESDGQGGETRLVVVLSTDTGKNFDRYLVFGREELGRLGVPELKGRVVIDVSQCLFADRAGNVYQDVLLLDEAGGNTLYHLKLPLEVNTHSTQAAQR